MAAQNPPAVSPALIHPTNPLPATKANKAPVKVPEYSPFLQSSTPLYFEIGHSKPIKKNPNTAKALAFLNMFFQVPPYINLNCVFTPSF